MQRTFRRTVCRFVLVLPVVAALGCATAPPPPAAAPSAPVPAPAVSAPVVVTVVVDQFAGWIAAERLALLPADGGFARLRREGTWAKDMRYAHAITETAPGHAALYTGQPPRANGIYANELAGQNDESVAIVRDEATRLVSAAGVTARIGVSSRRVRVETLADRLRAGRPRAAVVALSLKDRGTIFAAGRRPDVALWFDHENDVFVTSTAFASTFPAWAAPLTDATALAARRATPWTPLAGELAAHATADDAAGEGDYQALGTAFPHDFARATKPGPAFRLAPQSDALLVDLALSALDAERRPGEPMLLALSFSAFDYIGHVFGPDSREAWDELARLDRELARLMAGLDQRLGAGGWSLLLSADHGTSPLPEVARSRPWCVAGAADPWQRACLGGRIEDKALLAGLRETAASTLGPGEWVRGMENSWTFLSAAAERLPRELHADLVEALSERLAAQAGVARVIDLGSLPADCGDTEAVEDLVCASAVTGDGAALYTVLAPGWSFYVSMVPGNGVNHGSVHVYDRSVPLLVRAPGWVAPGREIAEPISFASFSRTAAVLLGIRPPAGEAGRDLAAED